jgi:hypothetical protein
MDQVNNQQPDDATAEHDASQPKQGPSAKERIEMARGKNIPIDHFLYSCLEHERTQRAQHGDDIPTAGRWPLMIGATAEAPPADFGVQTLKVLIGRLCGWYAAQYHETVEEIPLDHEVLNHIVAPFMKLTLDLSDLVLLKTGTSLPAHNSSSEESQALWGDIAFALKDSFPGYHGYFIRFLKWAFADIEPEEFEPGSRPPVGKNLPNFRAIANAQNHTAQQQGQQPRNNNRGGGQDRQHNRPHNGGGRDHRGGGQPHRGSNQNTHHNSNRQHNKPRHPGGPHNQQADSEIEKSALAAVDDAIAKIQSGSVEEVFLKPMNSFYRRIQHQYAVDKGFESCSVGEGNERAVRVSKNIT